LNKNEYETLGMGSGRYGARRNGIKKRAKCGWAVFSSVVP